nr:uncharacterized protein LOC117981559 [Pan paniscus]
MAKRPLLRPTAPGARGLGSVHPSAVRPSVRPPLQAPRAQTALEPGARSVFTAGACALGARGGTGALGGGRRAAASGEGPGLGSARAARLQLLRGRGTRSHPSPPGRVSLSGPLLETRRLVCARDSRSGSSRLGAQGGSRGRGDAGRGRRGRLRGSHCEVRPPLGCWRQNLPRFPLAGYAEVGVRRRLRGDPPGAPREPGSGRKERPRRGLAAWVCCEWRMDDRAEEKGKSIRRSGVDNHSSREDQPPWPRVDGPSPGSWVFPSKIGTRELDALRVSSTEKPRLPPHEAFSLERDPPRSYPRNRQLQVIIL